VTGSVQDVECGIKGFLKDTTSAGGYVTRAGGVLMGVGV